MKKSLFLSIVFTFLFATIACAAPSWQWVMSNHQSSYYFDKEAVGYEPQTQMTTVQVKEEYNQDGCKAVEAWLLKDYLHKDSKLQIAKMNLANIKYSLIEYKFDINRNLVKKVSQVFYDNKGHEVYALPLHDSRFEEIKADSPEARELSGVRAFIYFHQILILQQKAQ